MIDPLQANWQALSDTDVIGLLRNSEGCNSTDRALFLEAARRIEAQAAAISSAVQAEREAYNAIADGYDKRRKELLLHPNRDYHIYADALGEAAAAIRARNGRE